MNDNEKDLPENEGPEVAESPADAEAEASAPEGAEASGPDTVYAAKISELEELASERTADLQRLQAEYATYKRRVDRDRALAKAKGVESVVSDLLPILDSVEAAREHEELTGGFKLVADELGRLATKYGLELYGQVGDEFDPNVHEALMEVPYEGDHDVTVVSSVMQKGVRLHDRVLRPARVGVSNPD